MKGLVVALLVVALAGGIGWLLGSSGSPDRGRPPAAVDDPAVTAPAVPGREGREQAKVARLTRDYACRPEGLAPGVLPRHALVKLPGRHGERAIRLAPFDEGWEMHLGVRPGTLLAFCDL